MSCRVKSSGSIANRRGGSQTRPIFPGRKFKVEQSDVQTLHATSSVSQADQHLNKLAAGAQVVILSVQSQEALAKLEASVDDLMGAQQRKELVGL